MVRILKPLKRTRSTPIYGIGAASRLSGLPIYTLRWIESHGLVAPKRTHGKHRLYSEEDMDLLGAIRELMRQRVNLAGIRLILRMKRETAAGR
ncbi:MAG: MerR family transcriptional regulator [Elusimicrobia bacterium]|nr:MerR family transcriptional regulator [Elusimicrobiota bacterium]